MSDGITGTDAAQEPRVAIVTGGARGIGLAIVRRLIQDGLRVAFTYNSSPGPAVEALQAEFGPDNAMAIQCNIGDADSVSALVEKTLSRWNKIHILVNNAGITKDTLMLRMSQADFENVLHTNLTGAFLTTKAVLRPMMGQRDGRIINISSVVGLVGNAGQANYVASKAGLIGLTKSIAREVASRNILVNCVAPGYIATDMTATLNQAQQTAMLGQIPLGRTGHPEDVAAMVSFLSGPDAAYITGQVFTVDGGMTMVG